MAQIALLERKCTGCGLCANQCPFSAIDMIDGKPVLNASCRLCGICVKNCPSNALTRLETKVDTVDKSKWKDILVFAEISSGRLHPVSLELIGKAKQLVHSIPGYQVKAIAIGYHIQQQAEELLHYGLSEVAVYDDERLSCFRSDTFVACSADYIRYCKPSVVLVGATAFGRSLAPRLATLFHTGLTADCTELKLNANSDLVQIRPAFGGNIMAQIITPHTRPQFATVRYKVMDMAKRDESLSGILINRTIPHEVFETKIKHVRTETMAISTNISDAKILVVGGRGLKKESDLDLIRELAASLHGDWAVTRPLVEKGWASNERQIGLSGRTVRPKLLIAFGISGAIQFTACMKSSEHIVAINADPNAPIFKVAHVGIVGDLYNVLPKLITLLKERSA